MKLSNIMSMPKILKDLCAIRQKIRIENTFENVVFNVLDVKEF